MKKSKLLYLASSALAFTVVNADQVIIHQTTVTPVVTVEKTPVLKSGFKVGAGAGYKFNASRHQLDYEPGADNAANHNAVKESSKVTAKSKKPSLHAFIGYDWIHRCNYSALELDYRFSPTKVSKDFTFAQDFIDNSINLKHVNKHDFGLTAKLGRLVNPSTALYLIGNLRKGQFKHTLAATETKKQYLWGVGGGAGVTFAVRNGFNVSFEAIYDRYKKFKVVHDSVISSDKATHNAHHTRTFNAMVKLSKTF